MAKKTLGYVELEWTCPACGHRNPGTAKKCESCGAPQPADVAFVQPVVENPEADAGLAAIAQAGPDVHCPFCGTRNPGTATQCSQCFADLTDANIRESGQVLGAHASTTPADVLCPACGTANPATARRCQSCNAILDRPEPKPLPRPATATQKSRGLPGWVIAAVVLVGVGLCGLLIALSLRTEESVAVVEGVNWERTIAVEALMPVEREAWREDIPDDAEILSCREELYRTQPQPAPNSVEVCGTPYTVDTGTGVGEIVQDCFYEVYADRCEYTVLQWGVVDTIVASGADFQPAWPALNLVSEQRMGERTERYSVRFRGDGRIYTFTPNSAEDYARFQPGSEWVLEVNSFGNVVSVQPASGE